MPSRRPSKKKPGVRRRPRSAGASRLRPASARLAGARRAKAAAPAKRSKKPKVVARSGPLTVTEATALDELREELQRTSRRASPLRWNADPDEVQRSVAQLVLTLVEFIRQLLERQAIRRMEARTLTAQQTEDVGRALMQLEETVREIAAKFGISPDELNLDLGPVGKLM
ncbi:MAG TPA: gas vesicle protein K [Vicinamibacterales bacterium]